MTTFVELFSAHHRYCDGLFADAENAAEARDWGACLAAAESFGAALEAHFAAEEDGLFPAFEGKTGMTQGPTRVMRMEHAQIRQLQGQLIEAARASKADAFQSVAETLLIMMEQHNMKEENILYPMCDQHVGGDAELRARLVEMLQTPEGTA